MKPVEKRYLKVSELAEYISATPNAIYGLVKEERIPHTRIGPAPLPGQKERRHLRFDRLAIDAWLAENAVQAS